jgi:adenylylsulfate kinase
MRNDGRPAFALWITGRPGAGKTTLVRALVERLHRRDVDPVVLSAEDFRKRFAPHPMETEKEREAFYRGMVEVAGLFVDRGIPVLIDATGTARAYRAAARECLKGFAEVHVDCPPELCAARRGGAAARVAGGSSAAAVAEPSTEYEAPVHPEVAVRTDRDDPDTAAEKTMEYLLSAGLIASRRWYRV